MSSTKDEIIEESIASSHNPKSRKLIVALMILSALLLAAMAISGLSLYHALHASAAKGVDLASEVKRACDNPKVQTKPIQRLCDNADEVINSSPVGTPGPEGPEGPGPSDTQVALAVATFCAANSCTGPGPSATQVAQAVTLYCNQRGECRGPAGGTGAPGQNGATGAPGQDATGAPGPQGPPPTDQQITDAVSNYCTNHDNCQGPPGSDGKTGVVAVNSDACDPLDGQVIASVNAIYDADTQQITLSCTYANALIVPGNGGPG